MIGSADFSTIDELKNNMTELVVQAFDVSEKVRALSVSFGPTGLV